ncbi:MAG: hypothetical protein CBARDCOR_2413 [uncultured Caballeronia sp.]|nr:MAG: hypothetical protein CBARDCOR_2413 [uncultured Caballeronia sp.]
MNNHAQDAFQNRQAVWSVMDRFEPNIAFPASLIGEPNSARILMALCGGEQRVGSLAQIVSASPQAASNHLARLVSGGLVCAGSDGRHRYYRRRARR